MKSTTTYHKVTTAHDIHLVKSVISFQNTVVWPTRKLQRILTAACFVAIGSMFESLSLRNMLWSVAALILVWVAIGDSVTARVQLHHDPLRKTATFETYIFGPKGFRRDISPDEKWCGYSDIVAIHADEKYWFMTIRSGETITLASDNSDARDTSAGTFEAFLTGKTHLRVEPLQKSLSAKIKWAQEGRRGYLNSHPNKLFQLFSRRPNHTMKRSNL